MKKQAPSKNEERKEKKRERKEGGKKKLRRRKERRKKFRNLLEQEREGRENKTRMNNEHKRIKSLQKT